MSNLNDAEFARVQTLINQTGERLGSDAGFKSQYQSDPVAALTGAGLPQDAVKRVLSQVAKLKGDDEVSGYDDNDSSGGYHYTLDNPNNW